MADFPLLFVRLAKKIHLDEKKAYLHFISSQLICFVSLPNPAIKLYPSSYPLKPVIPKHVKQSRESPAKEHPSSLNQ